MMAYVHCHGCDWQQDDFWKEKYSPLHGDHFETLQKLLQDAITGKRPRTIVLSKGWREGTGIGPDVEVDVREYVAWELGRTIRVLESMHWWTYEDYKKDTNKACPECGMGGLCID